MPKLPCQAPDVNPAIFFPEGPENHSQWMEAKEVCGRCLKPDRIRCLQMAFDHGDKFGMWGGFSARQIRKLRALGHTDAKVVLAVVQ